MIRAVRSGQERLEKGKKHGGMERRLAQKSSGAKAYMRAVEMMRMSHVRTGSPSEISPAASFWANW